VIREALDRLLGFASDQGQPLEPESIDRLIGFIDLLETWNRRVRLTGDRDVGTLVLKHCADSLVVASEMRSARRALDVGSGAGFPGFVAACVLPHVEVTLLDSRQKACSFLDAACAHVGLPNARVRNTRVEEVAGRLEERAAYDVATSRGVSLPPLLPAVTTLLHPAGNLLMMLAGRQAIPERELERGGFGLVGTRQYTLPTGEHRRILRYAPG
jgi:16S rRNA (guanine527-N7)-methyltransferase